MVETEIRTIYPLAPVDDVLKKVGLPQTRPIFNALSPDNLFGKRMGLQAPGELLEKILNDIESKLPSGGGLPKPPGFR